MFSGMDNGYPFLFIEFFSFSFFLFMLKRTLICFIFNNFNDEIIKMVSGWDDWNDLDPVFGNYLGNLICILANLECKSNLQK